MESEERLSKQKGGQRGSICFAWLHEQPIVRVMLGQHSIITVVVRPYCHARENETFCDMRHLTFRGAWCTASKHVTRHCALQCVRT